LVFLLVFISKLLPQLGTLGLLAAYTFHISLLDDIVKCEY